MFQPELVYSTLKVPVKLLSRLWLTCFWQTWNEKCCYVLVLSPRGITYNLTMITAHVRYESALQQRSKLEPFGSPWWEEDIFGDQNFGNSHQLATKSQTNRKRKENFLSFLSRMNSLIRINLKWAVIKSIWFRWNSLHYTFLHCVLDLTLTFHLALRSMVTK